MGNLVEQLDRLTQDKERLAINAAAIDIRKYDAEIHDFFQYPLGVSFIGVEKPLVEGWQEAFSVLFILDLYYQNDWLCSEQERTSPDQQVVRRMPDAEWIAALRGYWIDDYFGLKNRWFHIKDKDVEAFQKELLWWMPGNAPESGKKRLEQEVAGTKWVCSLFAGAFYDKFFGETERHYFFAESGVYD